MFKTIASLCLSLTLLLTAQALPFGDRARQRQVLTQALGLTQPQLQQIQPILLDAAGQLRDLQQSLLSPAQQQQRRTQIVQSAVRQVSPILSADQRSQLAEMLRLVLESLR
jgi:hypothetical protein